MALWSLSNARNAGNSIYLQGMSEPSMGRNGIYIGRTAVYDTPFMLDLHGTVNPHLAIIGMTGSGKTYLTKSIALRAAIYDDYKLLIMDWNGEYAQTIEFLNGIHMHLSDKEYTEGAEAGLVSALSRNALHEHMCIDMSELRDSDSKTSASKAFLRAAIQTMHSISLEGHSNSMIIIDEAWHMLSGSEEIFTLFREGRKYGISIVIATQMASDINNAVIANAGCVIIFKLQNPDDYKLLKAAGILHNSMVADSTDLGIGSCIVHQNMNDGTSSHFGISHVDGVDAEGISVSGDKMQVYIPSSKFFGAVNALGENAKAAVSNLIMESNRRVDLVALIMALRKCAVDRPKILEFLYSIGVDGISIVMAYEKAAAADNGAK
ncbi:MAG: ATP-binding protein [Candidatus Micrarchaeia archaeon]